MGIRELTCCVELYNRIELMIVNAVGASMWALTCQGKEDRGRERGRERGYFSSWPKKKEAFGFPWACIWCSACQTRKR